MEKVSHGKKQMSQALYDSIKIVYMNDVKLICEGFRIGSYIHHVLVLPWLDQPED